MDFYIERLNRELANILNFWKSHAIQGKRFATKVSTNGTFSFTEPLGSLYIARVLYGASAAGRYTGDPSYKEIAELAYHTLRNQLSNPNGGYYWAVDENGGIVHDSMHVSFVQAFVLYGLGEYYALTADSEVKKDLFLQIDFIESKIRNISDGSYLDGFDHDWNPLQNQYKSLGTHLHLLEAYSKFIEVTGHLIYERSVENLLEILHNRFVNTGRAEIYHQFDKNWNLLPNEIWIGHNVEAAWIFLRSAQIIEHKELIEKSKQLLVKLCDNAIEKGFDKQYGGMINRFKNDEPVTTNKEWWPQAESVIAFLNCYQVSHDKKYLSYAIRLLEYIDYTFSDSVNGEWFDTVTREGEPLLNQAKLHLWKSMYHNVRYCIETIKQIESLFVKFG